MYLRSLSEGEDSEGRALTMDRYSSWLECFKKLAEEESDDNMRELIFKMEEYLDRERGLKCVDSGMRKEVIRNLKAVKEGRIEPSRAVFDVIYENVLEKLRELLGNYQNMKLEVITETNKESFSVL